MQLANHVAVKVHRKHMRPPSILIRHVKFVRVSTLAVMSASSIMHPFLRAGRRMGCIRMLLLLPVHPRNHQIGGSQ